MGEVCVFEKNFIGYILMGNIFFLRGKGYVFGMIIFVGYLDFFKVVNGEVKGSEWDGKVLVCVRNRDGRIVRLVEVWVVC